MKAAKNDDCNGYLLLHKNPGLTSFDSLYMVKKALGTRKVGHAGTLDKFAEGLLIVLAGRCTKLIPWFQNCDKTYTGIVRFGVETDTLDPEGRVVKECAPPSRENIEAVIPRFTGIIMQAPPLYSAVHIDGKRASVLARAGSEFSMKERPVEIYSLQLGPYENGEGTIEVSCSKGTYIRSLARDLAYAAASCAHLLHLNRTSIAGFSDTQALNPLSESDSLEAIRKALRPVDRQMFMHLRIPCITVDDITADGFINGRPIDSLLCALENTLTCINNNTDNTSQITLSCIKNDTKIINLAVFRQDDTFVGIICKKHGAWQYGYMYARD